MICQVFEFLAPHAWLLAWVLQVGDLSVFPYLLLCHSALEERKRGRMEARQGGGGRKGEEMTTKM